MIRHVTIARAPHVLVENLPPDAVVEQRRSRIDGRARISRSGRTSVLRLQQVDVPMARNVEGMTTAADKSAIAPVERKTTAPNVTREKRQCPIVSQMRRAFLVGLVSAAASIGCVRQPLTLSIIGTSDLHGGVLAVDGEGGLALFAGYVENVREARSSDGAVLLVDAGDLSQGTLESNPNEGAVVIDAYNALKYDAVAIGNHEFDFGPEGPAITPQNPGDDPRGALKARARQARFPFLAANVLDRETGRPVSWPNVEPTTIITVHGVRVGLVGMTTEVTASATMPANVQGLSISPIAPTLIAQSEALRRSGATVVVAVAHAGGRCRKFDNPQDLSSCDLGGEIFNVARAMPSGTVDAIVAGHLHAGIAHELGGIPIISSYYKGQAFGRIDLSVDSRSGHVLGHRIFAPHHICAYEKTEGVCVSLSEGGGSPARYEGRPVRASASIDHILEPAVRAAATLKAKPLNATIDGDMSREDTRENAVGNLAADWLRATVPDADVAMVNSTGLRTDLPAGELTYGRLYELMPFDNRQALVVLTGAQLARVIANNLQQSGSFLLLSGVRALATCSGPVIAVRLTRESGAVVKDTDKLNVGTFDFLADGGDGFLTPLLPLTPAPRVLDRFARDAIADWLQTHGGRWRSGDVFDEGRRRITYPGTRPINCSARSG